MDARTNTREGGKERTAAARSASRGFQPNRSPLSIGDRVSFRVGRFEGVGVLVGAMGKKIVSVRQDDGTNAYPLASECVPIESAPDFVEREVAESA